MRMLVQVGIVLYFVAMAGLSQLMQPLPSSDAVVEPELMAPAEAEPGAGEAAPAVRRTTLSAEARACLVKNVYWEARGESRAGMKAVAQVTLNRVRAAQWPDSVCEVVRQPRQFSWTHQLRWDRPMRNKAALERIQAVVDHLESAGWTRLGDSTWAHHYVQTRIADKWAYAGELDKVQRIGGHQFFS